VIATEDRPVRNLREVRYCPVCGEPLIASPILKCAHCGKEVTLRCFTYSPRRGKYIAECVDLDILSQGNTKEEAIGKLQEAMISYIEAAFDGKTTKDLVLRRSPFSHLLRYHFQQMYCNLRSLFGRKHIIQNTKDSWNLHFSHC
jgi:predicted RNase H-like HicB family nuclease